MKKLQVNWISMGFPILALYIIGVIIALILRLYYSAFLDTPPKSVLMFSWIFGWSFLGIATLATIIGLTFLTIKWFRLTFIIIDTKNLEIIEEEKND